MVMEMDSASHPYPDPKGSEDPDHKEAGKNASQKRKKEDFMF
jgi:hypothetical protein